MKFSNLQIARSRSASLAGFTLIELVVVFTIIALLLVVAFPLFMPKDSTARKAARGQINSIFTKARAHAISKNVPTAVVVLDSKSGDQEMRSRRIALYEVEPVLDSGKLKVVKKITRWMELPKSVVMVDDAGVRGGNIMAEGALIEVELPDGTLVTSRALVFSSTGAVIHPGGSGVLELHITNGAVAGNTLVRKEKTGVDIIEISRLSGRARNVNH